MAKHPQVEAILSRSWERGIPDRALLEAIELLVQEGGSPDGVADTIKGRLAAGVMTDAIAAACLHAWGLVDWPKSLASAFFQWMQASPARASRLSGLLPFKAGFGTIERQVRPGVDGHHAACQIATQRGLFCGEAMHARKADARHQATVAALCALMGVALPEAAPAKAHKQVGGLDGRDLSNPKAVLLELCQRKGWFSPMFIGRQVAGTKGLEHEFLVSVRTSTRIVESFAVSGKRRDAQYEACLHMLGLLRHSVEPVYEIAHPANVLQERARRWKVPEPEYELVLAPEALGGDGAMWIAAITLFEGDAPQRLEAVGESKRAAKHNAALIAARSVVGVDRQDSQV